MKMKIAMSQLSRREFCVACNMIRNGVKTRIALEHTCGLEPGAMPDQVKSQNLNHQNQDINMCKVITAHTQKDIDYVLKHHLLVPMAAICEKLNITIDTYHFIIRVHGEKEKLQRNDIYKGILKR